MTLTFLMGFISLRTCAPVLFTPTDSLIDEQFHFSTSNRVNAMRILLLIERSLLLSSKLSFDALNILFLLRRADTTLKAGIDWHCDRVSHGLMDYVPYTPR